MCTLCPLFAETCSATVKPVLMCTPVPIQILTPFSTQWRKKEGRKNALLRTSKSSTEERLIILSSRLDYPAWTWRALIRWGKIQRLQLSEGALSSSPLLLSRSGKVQEQELEDFWRVQKKVWIKVSCTKQKKETTANKLSCKCTGPSSFVCLCVTMRLRVCVAWMGQALGKKNRVERLSPGKEGLHVWSFWHAALWTRSKWGEGDHIALLATLTTHHFFFLSACPSSSR